MLNDCKLASMSFQFSRLGLFFHEYPYAGPYLCHSHSKRVFVQRRRLKSDVGRDGCSMSLFFGLAGDDRPDGVAQMRGLKSANCTNTQE